MRNIILQHWTGPLNELTILSSENISNYAKKCNAEYKLIQGNYFYPHLNLTTPCQKLYMLDKDFDTYDTVVMVDVDMFTRKGMDGNIFQVEGIGMFTEFQAQLFKNSMVRYPKLLNPEYPYWGGAIWKLSKNLRELLRKNIDEKELLAFSGGLEDEGIMHRLATKSGMKEKHILPGGFRWCHCSYREGIETAALIHIRTKTEIQGVKKPKLENYRDLVSRGLI